MIGDWGVRFGVWGSGLPPLAPQAVHNPIVVLIMIVCANEYAKAPTLPHCLVTLAVFLGKWFTGVGVKG